MRHLLALFLLAACDPTPTVDPETADLPGPQSLAGDALGVRLTSGTLQINPSVAPVNAVQRSAVGLFARVEPPPPDEARPPSALRKLWTEPLGQLVSAAGAGLPNDLGAIGIAGTDLGSSFEAPDGALVFLFGDSMIEGIATDVPGAADALAFTSAGTVDRFLMPRLSFATNGPHLTPLRVAGASHGPMEVPVEGVAAGDRSYQFFASDWHDDTKRYGQSVIAHMVGHDAAHLVADSSSPSDKFINVSVIVEGNDAFVFGAGNPYRQSPVYLARAPLDRLPDRGTWLYFRGTRFGAPVFEREESSAVPIVDTPCMGELSVRRQPGSPLYLMTYHCEHGDPGYLLRTATTPWGLWSQPERIFDVSPTDGGYGVTMHCHIAGRPVGGKPDPQGVPFDDGLADAAHVDGQPGGGWYAPYMISRWSRPLGDGAHALVYTHSSWNPYKVSLMRTILAPPGVSLARPDPGQGVPRASFPPLESWPGTGAPFLFFDRNGRHCVTTYNASAGGDAVTGAIWYDFRVDSDLAALRFFIHGGHASVKLIHRGGVVRESRGVDTNDFDQEVRWFLGPYTGEWVRIQIEDGRTDPWGFISVSAMQRVNTWPPTSLGPFDAALHFRL
jgi:hypothetical protein